MQALFKGPNTDELRPCCGRPSLPALACSTSRSDGSELIVNVSNELQQLTGEALIDGVAQIVLTASAITGVSAVSITIDGVPQQWPAASGELQSEPLTRYDFPGLVLSSQPAFPSVPSPAAAPDRRLTSQQQACPHAERRPSSRLRQSQQHQHMTDAATR